MLPQPQEGLKEICPCRFPTPGLTPGPTPVRTGSHGRPSSKSEEIDLEMRLPIPAPIPAPTPGPDLSVFVSRIIPSEIVQVFSVVQATMAASTIPPTAYPTSAICSSDKINVDGIKATDIRPTADNGTGLQGSMAPRALRLTYFHLPPTATSLHFYPSLSYTIHPDFLLASRSRPCDDFWE